MDVREEASVEAGVARVLADFVGAVSILVHNAGHGPVGTMPDLRTEEWRATLAVNLDAAFFLTRALLRTEGALPNGSSIVFISSGRGHAAAPGLSPYGTAKAALNHFAAMLAQDAGPRGVRVNVVSPGYIQTPDSGATKIEKQAVIERSALGRLGTPSDVADAVLFFASDLSAFITGQTLQINGGSR